MHSFREYYLLMEKIGWSLTDFDWDAIDMENVTEDDRQRARDTAITESAVPHYADVWGRVEGIDDEWELRQFATLWTAEEHRHSEGLRMLCEKLDIDITPEVDAIAVFDFVEKMNQSCPTGCYNTVAGILTYTVLQELVTWKFYNSWVKATQSTFIRELVGKIAADEMRHHQWFANALQRKLADAADPEAYRQAIVDAICHFHMPHNYLPAEFPFLNTPDMKYFGPEDFEHLKSKITKVMMFDQELVMKLLEIGEEAILSGVRTKLPATAA